MTEDQIRLFLTQKDIEIACCIEVLGCSVSDTILKLLESGELKRAQKFRNEFKVPDKRF